MINISYITEDFPAGRLTNGPARLQVTWDEILWAAITVGRPNRHYVFMHGDASAYEAIFRWSLVRMSLEQYGSRRLYLQRTNAAKTLDPTEKGAVSYFLGMTFCKLFATKLLNTPWLLHLDVFGHQLNAILKSRSRPDLVGMEQTTGAWHAFECKGRVSQPDPTAKDKAKQQAQRITSINGTPCGLHIGAITYFRRDILNFYWRDPDPYKGKKFEIQLVPDVWRYYYAPVIRLISQNEDYSNKIVNELMLPVKNLDLQVSIYPEIAQLLLKDEWELARKKALESADKIKEAGYQPDGILVKAGETWRQPFQEKM